MTPLPGHTRVVFTQPREPRVTREDFPTKDLALLFVCAIGRERVLSIFTQRETKE